MRLSIPSLTHQAHAHIDLYPDRPNSLNSCRLDVPNVVHGEGDRLNKENPTAADTHRYWAFISYSHADEAWARWLHRTLERYRVPRPLVGTHTRVGTVPRRLYPIFRDRDELPSSSSLSTDVRRALEQSNALVVICSPQAAASRWVNEEVRAWMALGREGRIFPFIVAGEPNASARPETGLLEAFPEALRLSAGPGKNATGGPEPLAADVRSGKDGRLAAKLKLAAGILDVGYDDLRRRDRRRRRWRVGQIIMLSLFVLGMIGAIWLRGREATRRQQLIAQARALAAQSYNVPAGDETARLRLALDAVEVTAPRVLVAEAEVALYRALLDARHLWTFAPNDTNRFEGWAWGAAFNSKRTALAIPAAPTVLLDSLGHRIAALRDAEVPYQGDYSATYLAADTVITAGDDGFVRTWNSAGQLLKRLRAHAYDVLTVEIVPGDRLLTVGCDERDEGVCRARSAHLFDRSGYLRAKFENPGALVTSAVWLGNRRILTAGSGGVRFWLEDGTLESDVPAPLRWISTHSVAADGRIVTGGCHPWRHSWSFDPMPSDLCSEEDPRVEVRNADGSVREAFDATLAMFSGATNVLAIARNDCNAGRCGGTVSLFSATGARLVDMTMPSPVSDLAFDQTGTRIAIGMDNGPVAVRDMLGNTIANFGVEARGVTSLRFSPDGQRLAVVSCPNRHQGACLESRVDMWDPNGAVSATYVYPADPHPQFVNARVSGSEDVAVAWGGRGDLLVARNDGTDPRIFAADGSVRAVLPIGPAVVSAARFRTDGNRLLLTTQDHVETFAGQHHVTLWDGQGRRLADLPAATDGQRLPVARFVPGGGIITATADGVLHRFDGNGREVDAVHARAGVILDATVNAGGLVATVDSSGVVEVWGQERTPRTTIRAGTPGDPDANRWDYGYTVSFLDDNASLLIAGPTTLSLRGLDGAERWSAALDRVDQKPVLVAGGRIFVLVCSERGRGATIGSLKECYGSRVEVRSSKGTILATLTPPDGETMLETVEVAPDGGRIATLTRDRRVLLWTGGGEFIAELARGATWLAFHPDGTRLAVGMEDGRADVHTIWPDAATMIREARRSLARSSRPQ